VGDANGKADAPAKETSASKTRSTIKTLAKTAATQRAVPGDCEPCHSRCDDADYRDEISYEAGRHLAAATVAHFHPHLWLLSIERAVDHSMYIGTWPDSSACAWLASKLPIVSSMLGFQALALAASIKDDEEFKSSPWNSRLALYLGEPKFGLYIPDRVYIDSLALNLACALDDARGLPGVWDIVHGMELPQSLPCVKSFVLETYRALKGGAV